METVDHIALLVEDLEASQNWYENKLNAVCEFSTDFYRRMRLNNTTIALISKHHYSYNHIGILVNCKENLPKNGDRIEHRDGTIGVYTFDPDGHCIEYIWYNEDCRETVRNENQ